jgi:hypothetical protein
VSKKIWLDSIGLLLIGIVIVVGYKLSPLLLPQSDVTVLPDPLCDLQVQSCSVRLADGGELELSMAPRPVPMVKPFQAKVSVTGFQPQRLEIDFAGADMNMGFNRQAFVHQGGAVYVAESSLPVCITGQMDWQVTLLVERPGERIAIPFRLRAKGDH